MEVGPAAVLVGGRGVFVEVGIGRLGRGVEGRSDGAIDVGGGAYVAAVSVQVGTGAMGVFEGNGVGLKDTVQPLARRTTRQ